MDATTLDLNFCILAQPKAGSTWLVHLLSSIIDENYTYDDLEKYIPIIDQSEIPYRTHRATPDPNIKNIRLLRNPFDSYISWNNYVSLRGKKIKESKDFSSYYKILKQDNVLTIRYEDLNQYTSVTLRRIFKFLGWSIEDKTLQKIIQKCKLDNLKSYEEQTLQKKRKFLFYNSKAQLQDKKRFYNKGECYYYIDSLSDEEINNIYNKYSGAIQHYWPEILEQINVSNSI